MPHAHRPLTVLIAPLALSLVAAGPNDPTTTVQKDAAPKEAPLRITGPRTHENVSVFIVHGEDKLKGRKLVPLAQAIAEKKVVVHETGEVNELAIENRSTDEVFVGAGDIVKGGRQDRMISMDLVLPPKSGRIPVTSFCVEHGRWSGRRGEAVQRFEASSKVAASKPMKLAARKAKSQGEVWNEVAKTQAKLGKNLKTDVKSSASETSLQLTLENEAVTKRTRAYVDALGKMLDGEEDAVGFVFAIDGVVNSAEVYASPALLRKLWPRLVEAIATEAIAEADLDKPRSEKAPDVLEAEVKKLLAMDQTGAKKQEERVTKRIRLTTVEAEGKVMFETSDDGGAGWIHRSYY